jgi:arylsulfatase A-like enzyme
MTPTFLDYAGVKYPISPYIGKEIIVPTTGKSIKPLLEGSAQTIHGENQIISQELFGNSAVFMGDYKGLLMRPPAGDGKWALYNIKIDPGESHNFHLLTPLSSSIFLYIQYDANLRCKIHNVLD